MELELEEDHGLAAVKHLRCPSYESVWNRRDTYEYLVSTWRAEYPSDVRNGTGLASMGVSLAQRLLQSAVLCDHMVSELKSVTAVRKEGAAISVEKLVHALLSARWGEERVGLVLGEYGTIHVAGASFTDSSRNVEDTKSRQLWLDALQLILQIEDTVAEDDVVGQRVKGVKSVKSFHAQFKVSVLKWLFGEVPDGSVTEEDIANLWWKILRASRPNSILNISSSPGESIEGDDRIDSLKLFLQQEDSYLQTICNRTGWSKVLLRSLVTFDIKEAFSVGELTVTQRCRVFLSYIQRLFIMR